MLLYVDKTDTTRRRALHALLRLERHRRTVRKKIVYCLPDKEQSIVMIKKIAQHKLLLDSRTAEYISRVHIPWSSEVNVEKK